MKPKYVIGQMVLHKLDRRRMMITTVFDSPNADDHLYMCRFVSNDTYLNHKFKECELIENEDIV